MGAPKLVIGLTGGIGSGKSAAAEEFQRLGIEIVDTDAIAHELTASGGRAIPAIREAFGESLLRADGAMDRQKMRAAVFADPEARRRLESILHPMIRAESLRRIEAAGSPYVVHAVPLLVESGDFRKRVSRVLVVDAPEALQMERVGRRGLAPEQIRAILASQASRDRRLAAADDVIDNSGSLDALRQQVRALHERYLSLAKGSVAGDSAGGAA